MLEQSLALASRAARFAASAATLLAAIVIVAGAVNFSAEQAKATETVQLISFEDPVPGHEINSPFGLRKLPWEKSGRLHAGVDIAAPNGSPVVATTDGVVSKMGISPSYGRFVEVAHGSGLTSVYAHLGGTVSGVAPGLLVDEGEKIALIGSTGHSTGPHLHFEMRKDGAPMDPAMFMDRKFRPEALPFREAARISPIVRIAQVSGWATEGVKKATRRGRKS